MMLNSKSTTYASVLLTSLLLVGGCVVGDQLTTLTIHPDGSADLVVFRSNLRSTETGDRGAKELADYSARFAARTEGDFVRIREAGGEVVAAAWIRSKVPFSNFVHAKFADAAVLEKYGTIKNEDGSPLITTKFHSDSSLRRLTLQISVPPDKTSLAQPSPPDLKQLRKLYANGISETRIAVTSGSITTARGFTIADDKQSALLNVGEFAELIHAGQGKAELSLEWEVAQ